MTFFDTTASHPINAAGFFRKIGTKLGNGIRIVQYGRMMHALSELSDSDLKAIGLERSDIPRHAHYCVYGTYS